jgi:chromosome segregation ATPase
MSVEDSNVSDRLVAAERNIEKIQQTVTSLHVEQARLGEQIGGIKDVLVAINQNMSRIDQNLSRMGENLQRIDVTLAVNTESLKEHMRRTTALETHVDQLRENKWKLTGIVVGVSAVAGLITTVASWGLSKLLS